MPLLPQTPSFDSQAPRLFSHSDMTRHRRPFLTRPPISQSSIKKPAKWRVFPDFQDGMDRPEII
jgi:hypothetical protein